ncbi:MAG: ELWxxDGT repeat protein [Thermoanaerobaculia bacterium]
MKKPTGTLSKSEVVFALAALVTVTLATPLAATTAFLVKDINAAGASAPTELVTMGGATFFVADNGVSGSELWKSDGTVGGTLLVKDICPGACASGPALLTVSNTPAGERVFFVADNGVHGYELWKSDGTVGGTSMVKDIVAGSGFPAIGSLVAGADKVFFSANDGVTGNELWKSDGTPGGTVLVKDIVPGGAFSAPAELTLLGSTVFFSAATPSGRELWKSDGTSGGTVLVKDINPGFASSLPNGLTAVGSTLFFAAFTSTGMELWKSDGTSAGTAAVKNINPGFASSFPTNLTALGSELFFVATDGLLGDELWKSDGTFSGTVLVKDIKPGAGSSAASHLTASGNLLYLSADDGLVGKELWRSNGTGAGTFLVRDINPGGAASEICEVQSVDDVLYFVADDGLAGNELWKSDGTGGGTAIVDDLILGATGSSPTEPTPSPTLIFFAADDALLGRELWALQVGGPVLQFSKVFADNAVETGTAGHTFSLTVTNAGSGPATTVRITDPVDARLAVTSVSPSGQCAASAGQFVDCTFPTLAASAFETVTVTYSVGGGVTPADDVLNTAQVGDLGGQLVEASDTIDIIAPCVGLPVHLDIADEAIYSPTYLAEACESISAGPTVNVMPGASATLSAGDVVVLNDGFVVESGAALTVIAD